MCYSLAGKSAELHQWSPRSMGKVLDLVEQFLVRAQLDGSLFFDPALDLFKPIADEQPLFAEWRRYTMEEDTLLAPDGVTKHWLWKQALAELSSPDDATNIATRAKCIEYLEVHGALPPSASCMIQSWPCVTISPAWMARRAMAIPSSSIRTSLVATQLMTRSPNQSSAHTI